MITLRAHRSGALAHRSASAKLVAPASLLVRPNPADPKLTRAVDGIDQAGGAVRVSVPVERPLTLFLNKREIVTMMTISDYPDCLAVGYLLNQNMLRPDDEITGIEYDDELEVVVVRTARETNFEDKLRKKTLTSGCAQGTAFGDLLERFEHITLDRQAVLRTSWLHSLSRAINLTPSLYLEAGAIHGCVLCERDVPLLYMEDVGRHNAIDKIAGYMFLHGIRPQGKLFYTTGRLTSEMVIKIVRMEIPILISRSGFTAWGVDLARQANLTLIGRAKGNRFTALSGVERIVFDSQPGSGRRGRGKLQRRAAITTMPERVMAVVLAGGLARRMGGGDKCLKLLAGRPILSHVLETARRTGRADPAECQWRSGAFRRLGRAGRGRRGGGVRWPASRRADGA